MFHSYMFHVEDYYVNFDTHTLYIGKVSVTKYIGTMIDSPLLLSEKVVDVVDLTPEDRTFLDGLIHVDNNDEDDSYFLEIFNITGSLEGGESEDATEYQIGDTKHHLVTQWNNFFNDKVREILYGYYETVIVIVALILSLITGSATRVTDSKIWNQALFNLVEPFVKGDDNRGENSGL